MSRWFRFYDCALDDPKVQRLAPPLFKAWVNVLCLASRNEGVVPPVADVAFALRVSDKAAGQLIEELHAAGLMDELDGSYVPHNWDKRQFKSDATDPTAADRMRRHRNTNRNGDRNAPRNEAVSATLTRADTEQNTEQSRADAPKPDKKSRKKPQIRIPDDWRPGAEGSAYAKSQGLSDREIAKEAERFKNNARQNDRAVSDWASAWRNWCIKALEFAGREPPPAPGEAPAAAPTHGDTLPDGQTFLRADTHEWDEWCAHMRAQGKKTPPNFFHGGWRFPSRWPPKLEAKEEAA